jgi:putative DNA primase/helicase
VSAETQTIDEQYETFVAIADNLTGHRDDDFARLLRMPSPIGIGDLVRYNHAKQQWHVWNGNRWEPDATAERIRLLRERLADWRKVTATVKEAQMNLAWLSDMSKVRSTFEALSTMEPISLRGDEFDRDPNLLCVTNGVVDLRDGSLRVGTPEDLISLSTNITYNPEAQAPNFINFLSQITGEDQDLIEYILLVFGAGLFGHVRPQQFYVLKGRGNNGKGVLCNVVTHAVGEYAVEPSRMLYMRNKYGEAASNAARPDLLTLMGKRLALMSEPNGGKFNEDLLKEHTGNDRITARDNYARGTGAYVSFRPSHTIFFRTNDAPALEDIGVSMERRLRVIPLEQDFSEKPDFDLETRLMEEAEGILALLIAAAVRYHKNPATITERPKVVIAASKEYMDENDPLADFLNAHCVIRKDRKDLSSNLYTAYLGWHTANGEPNATPFTSKRFGQLLGKKFGREQGARHATYVGVGLRASAPTPVEVADEEEDFPWTN